MRATVLALVTLLTLVSGGAASAQSPSAGGSPWPQRCSGLAGSPLLGLPDPSPAANGQTREISLTGDDLTVDDIADIAAGQATVELSADGLERIRAARAVVDHYVDAELPAYGITTMYGADFQVTLPPEEMERFGRINIIQEAVRVGDGSLPLVEPAVMRAAWALLANSFARGFSGASPELAQTLIDHVNSGDVPADVEWGNSMGDADLIANAQAALLLLDDPTFELRAGEATNLLTHNFITVAEAALLTDRAERLLAREEEALALTMEGFRANPGPLVELGYQQDPGGSREAVRGRLRSLLDGSLLWNDDGPRQLQDFLSLRDGAENLAALRHALDEFEPVLEGFANSTHGSPIVDVANGSLISVPAYDTTQVTLGMDALRAAVGMTVIASNSRGLKLLSKPFIDLPSGLVTKDPNAFDGLYTRNVGYLMTSLERSARLATGSTVGLTESYMAEGDEDYSPAFPHSVQAMAPLLSAAEKVVSIEALIGSYAVEQRLRAGQLCPGDVPPSLRALQSGIIARSPMAIAVDEPYELRPLLEYLGARSERTGDAPPR